MIPFLTQEMLLRVSFHGNTPVLIKIPEKSIYKIKETTPAAAGAGNDSKSMPFKKATLDNDVDIQVPEFIKMGEEIWVNILEQKYLQRAK